MDVTLYKSESRGLAKLDGITIKHTFSYSNYYDKNRLNFGILRVFNEYSVAPKTHIKEQDINNMEILTIVLNGDISYADNLGNQKILKEEDVHVINTGKGLRVSLSNDSDNEQLIFLELWVFPSKKNTDPNIFNCLSTLELKRNQFVVVCKPNSEDDTCQWNTNMTLSIAHLSSGEGLDYSIADAKKGVYFFVIDGVVDVMGTMLNSRDGCGIVGLRNIAIRAIEDSKLIAVEVPMKSKDA